MTPDLMIQSIEAGHARGWTFVELNGKRPVAPNWAGPLPTRLDYIVDCARSGRNIGLRTGWASAGLFVVDADPGADITALDLPETVEVQTGRPGGRHFYFQLPEGVKLGNSSGKLGEHIDTRGDGGQVVFPGSTHPETGVIYAWAPGCSPDERAIAELPAEIIARLSADDPPRSDDGPRPTPTPTGPTPARGDGGCTTTYGRKGLEGEVGKVMVAPEGRRNATLNIASYNLGRLVGGEELEESDAFEALTAAGLAIGLGGAEVRDTVASGIAKGRQKPKRSRAASAGAKQQAPAPGTGDQADGKGTGTPDAVSDYWIGADGGIRYRDKDGNEKELANFSARIVREVIQDDGLESHRVFDMEAKLRGRVTRFAVPATSFSDMRWIVPNIGAHAVIAPGRGMSDQARAAIQLLSIPVEEATEYRHTGWRLIDGEPVYLHAGGAIGAGGTIPGVCVALDDGLAGYKLPDPPEGDELRRAIRASLEMLNVAPDAITVPVYAAIWRAILGPSAFSLHLVGGSGVGKTELAALAQQHFGPSMSAKALPASWTSTENALESQASAAKDAVWAVDDYAPGSSPVDRAKLNAKADRIFRAAGNQAGRQRMRADTSMRPARHPRGTVLSTGEDLPAGHSCRARILILEMEPGADGMRWNRLSKCQINAHDGLYAAALAGYVRWVAGQYGAITGGLLAEVHELRAKLGAGGGHKRTPEAVANLLVGLRHYFRFVRETEALPPGDVKAIADRCRTALLAACTSQPAHLQDTDPAGMFPGLLASAVGAGAAHIAWITGAVPDNPGSFGYRERSSGPSELHRVDWHPSGTRIGWTDEYGTYLDATATFKIIQQHSGGSIPVTPATLWKRIAEKGLLASRDEDGRHLLVRKNCEGVRRRVLHFRTETLFPSVESGPEETDGAPSGEPDGGPGGGSEGSKNGAPDSGPLFDDGPLLKTMWATKNSENPQQNHSNGPHGPHGPHITDKTPPRGGTTCCPHGADAGACSLCTHPSYAQEVGHVGHVVQTPSGAMKNGDSGPNSWPTSENPCGPQAGKSGPNYPNYGHCDAEFARFAAQHGIEM